MITGIIGLPQTGKKTLFELLVGRSVSDDSKRTVQGVAEVEDRRLDRLFDVYQPKRETRARLDVVLPPKIEEKAVSEGDIFNDLVQVDVFCHVVRAFEDDAVYHVSGSVDPVRDIEYVNSEFILHDLIFAEKRISRMEKDLMKVRDKTSEKELEIVRRLKTVLEGEEPLRCVDIPPEEEKLIRSYPFLSRKEMVVVLNVSDSDVSDHNRVAELQNKFASTKISFVQIAAKTELEISMLESDSERDEFMKEIGIEDTALHMVTARCIESLGLMSFFTAAPNEVRHWFVRSGATAVEAAGKIHSDLARGFIRAEVIKTADLLELGSEEKVKAAGKLSVKGRDYIVEDGDVLFIRFNV